MPIYYYTIYYIDTFIYNKTKSKNIFLNKLFTPLLNTITIIRFENTDGGVYKSYPIDAICKKSKPNQVKALNIITDAYNTNDYNVKTILCGVSGIGKSYTGMLLKKKVDKDYKECPII
jgi:hypothetical protein